MSHPIRRARALATLATVVLAGTVFVFVFGAAGCHLVDPAPPTRGFALSWKIADAAAPDPLAAPALRCADARVSSILVDALSRESNQRYRVEFACETQSGVTPPIPQARYQIMLIARSADGTPRSQIRFDTDNYTDDKADLGFIIFTVDR